MADSLYNIFGDHMMRQTMKNVTRQPLSNIGKNRDFIVTYIYFIFDLMVTIICYP